MGAGPGGWHGWRWGEPGRSAVCLPALEAALISSETQRKWEQSAICHPARFPATSLGSPCPLLPGGRFPRAQAQAPCPDSSPCPTDSAHKALTFPTSNPVDAQTLVQVGRAPGDAPRCHARSDEHQGDHAGGPTSWSIVPQGFPGRRSREPGPCAPRMRGECASWQARGQELWRRL